MKPPTPKQIRSARKKAGLTQAKAAELVYSTKRAWQFWESESSNKTVSRSMHPAIWVLFRLKTKQIRLSDVTH